MNKKLKNIDFFEFETAVTLSKTRSIRAAARQMRLKPSHVSKVIQRIEVKLGSTLFKRAPSGVLLTRDGISFVEFATQLLQLSDSFSLGTSVERLPVVRSQIITIGGLSFLNKILIAPSLGKMAEVEPKYRYRILDIAPDQLMSAALKGGLDVVVSVEDNWTKIWDVSLIGKISWGLFVRDNHPIGQQASLAEVLKYPFIVPTYWQDNEYVIGNDLFPVSWNKRIQGDEASTADTAAQILLETDQVAFLPCMLNHRFGNRILVEVAVPEVRPVTKKLFMAVKSDNITNHWKGHFLRNLKVSISR